MPEPITQHEIECIAWRSNHDGWVKTEWRQQHLFNESIQRRFEAMDDKFVAIGIRFSALEKKVVWVIAITTIIAQVGAAYFFRS